MLVTIMNAPTLLIFHSFHVTAKRRQLLIGNCSISCHLVGHWKQRKCMHKRFWMSGQWVTSPDPWLMWPIWNWWPIRSMTCNPLTHCHSCVSCLTVYSVCTLSCQMACMVGSELTAFGMCSLDLCRQLLLSSDKHAKQVFAKFVL